MVDLQSKDYFMAVERFFEIPDFHWCARFHENYLAIDIWVNFLNFHSTDHHTTFVAICTCCGALNLSLQLENSDPNT
jgi:hypothetical protein